MERGRYRLNEMSQLVCPGELNEQHQNRSRHRERPLCLRSRTPSRHTVTLTNITEKKDPETLQTLTATAANIVQNSK